MRIRFTVGPKAGTEVNVARNDNAVAMLIHAGLAEEVLPEKPYERTPQTPDIHDTVVPCFAEPQWDVMRLHSNQQIVVRMRIGSTTTLYDGPPNGCPPEVAAQFKSMTDRANAQAAANEAERQRRNKVEAASKGY